VVEPDFGPSNSRDHSEVLVILLGLLSAVVAGWTSYTSGTLTRVGSAILAAGTAPIPFAIERMITKRSTRGGSVLLATSLTVLLLDLVAFHRPTYVSVTGTQRYPAANPTSESPVSPSAHASGTSPPRGVGLPSTTRKLRSTPGGGAASPTSGKSVPGVRASDSCPNGDYSGNSYDGLCGTVPTSKAATGVKLANFTCTRNPPGADGVYSQYDLTGPDGSWASVTLTVVGHSTSDSWTFPVPGMPDGPHGSYGVVFQATEPGTCSIVVNTDGGSIERSLTSN
jgi:hypothetical protein